MAVLLELSRRLAGSRPARTVQFVAFVNEEPPYFQTAEMGSYVYARERRRRGDRIAAMISIESVGYYTDAPSSQRLPAAMRPLFPDRGNFIAFAGDTGSGELVREALGAFRRAEALPSEGAAAFGPGIDWSDHWSFRQAGYPAIQVTDTATFRNPHYHKAGDKPDTLDYDRMARFATGMMEVAAQSANGR